MIFLIALLPAFVVFVVAAITESKFKTSVAALLAIAVGVLTGNPAYMALDIGFVVVSYWLSMKGLGANISQKPAPVKPPPMSRPMPLAAAPNDDANFGVTFAALGVVIVVAYVFFGSGSGQKPTPQSPRPAAIPSAPSNETSPALVPLAPKARPAAAKEPQKRPAKSPVQRCLQIDAVEKMERCLAGLR